MVLQGCSVSDRPIYVTQPHLPPLEEFIPYLEQIWANKILTNGGTFHRQLEQALCDYLGVKHISLFTNGTVALMTALQALGIRGEVITTPYSFVATSHALLWNGLTPVFVDIDAESLNLDPARIESAITPRTSAIMPVHCYGRPCDVDAIQRIAECFNLKVIYDAAHAFGVKCSDGSVLRHGDLSVLSFHATKVFNTFEGGAIVSPDLETKKHIDQLKNFGFVDEVTVTMPGINGKMSEVNAAFGLLQLQHLDDGLQKRAALSRRYQQQLAGITGIRIVDTAKECVPNHSYYPVLVDETFSLTRDELYERLKSEGIYARRYFYPLISDFPMYRELPSAGIQNLPNAHRIADQVICLPLYPALQDADLDRIADFIRKAGSR
jgi:dTDP-4-amino-4,6-dideoxygalactose transaminase